MGRIRAEKTAVPTKVSRAMPSGVFETTPGKGKGGPETGLMKKALTSAPDKVGPVPRDNRIKG